MEQQVRPQDERSLHLLRRLRQHRPSAGPRLDSFADGLVLTTVTVAQTTTRPSEFLVNSADPAAFRASELEDIAQPDGQTHGIVRMDALNQAVDRECKSNGGSDDHGRDVK